ncbi:hypothetical protein CRG98_006624, partial [Punica granatum]
KFILHGQEAWVRRVHGGTRQRILPTDGLGQEGDHIQEPKNLANEQQGCEVDAREGVSDKDGAWSERKFRIFMFGVDERLLGLIRRNGSCAQSMVSLSPTEISTGSLIPLTFIIVSFFVYGREKEGSGQKKENREKKSKSEGVSERKERARWSSWERKMGSEGA